jgi:ketosteroid isomerase-like protein
MSSPNIERVMNGFRAMERGDLDEIAELADPDVQFVNPDYALEPGIRHGPEGLRIGLGAILDVFENLEFAYERVDELGDRVLVTGTFTGRGKGSGMAFDPSPFAILLTMRGDRLVRFEWFIDAAEAEEAANA